MSASQHADAVERDHHERRQSDLIARIIKRVAELPDRSSPDEWPEAMLVTGAKLKRILRDEFNSGR